MKMTFACPSCAAGGSVDAAAAGRQARCKHCGHQFVIPSPGEPGAGGEPEGYRLKDPRERPVGRIAMRTSEESAYVRSRTVEDTPASRKAKRSPTDAAPRRARKRASRFPWQTWLIRGGIGSTAVLAAVALLVPNGLVIVGCVLLVLGMLMVLAGYGAGAFGAFHEDFLYGFLYMVIPFYAAYYIVTRWDDLWIWFTCATAGVGLVLLGTEIVRWGGVAV